MPAPRRLPRAPALLAAAVALAGLDCAPRAARFALRPPVARDRERPVPRAPAPRESARITDAIDQLVLRPVARTLALETVPEATNVNALDEVPDSRWFTNRAPMPAESAEGACAGVAEPSMPLTVLHVKDDGTTPGFVVRDAAGQRYVAKLDIYAQDRPETSTAADAIVSRLYWTVGYNTPCNRVAYVGPADLDVPPEAYRVDDVGAHHPIGRAEVLRLFGHGVRRADGAYRVGLSRVVDGEPLGPWAGTGVRADDPNDAVPHEDRRELRGERLLAAWVNHWDAREINTLDAFVRAARGDGGGDGDGPGYVVHYMIDFGDALGGRTSQAERAARLGYAGFLQPPWAPHPWEHISVDPDAPNLGYFEFEHFEPALWQPILPLPRFERARPEDLGWMARRLARITDEHLRAVVPAGRFTRAATARRLLAVLAGRRDRILRWSFARVSPLADWVAERGGLCGVDLGVRANVSRPGAVGYAARLSRSGRDEALRVRVEGEGGRAGAGRVCVALPHAGGAGGDDDPSRYRVVRVTRAEGGARTEIRLHAYDLGPERGFVLAGVER